LQSRPKQRLSLAHLVEGAVRIVRRVAVLLEEVVLEQLGDLERDLVRLGERVLADELHDLGQVLLLLENLLGLGADRNVLGVELLVERVKRLHVLRVR
jgi:hypothetical protein